jgi:hypothetical protein
MSESLREQGTWRRILPAQATKSTSVRLASLASVKEEGEEVATQEAVSSQVVEVSTQAVGASRLQAEVEA